MGGSCYNPIWSEACRAMTGQHFLHVSETVVETIVTTSTFLPTLHCMDCDNLFTSELTVLTAHDATSTSLLPSTSIERHHALFMPVNPNARFLRQEIRNAIVAVYIDLLQCRKLVQKVLQQEIVDLKSKATISTANELRTW